MPNDPGSLADHFAAAMERFGPFGPSARLAVAVSGGADSTSLALLAGDWAEPSAIPLIALIVDHGLRPGSADEATMTARRLAARGIAARIITLAVAPGAALQQRAREARYAALALAAREAGAVHVLLGHHARDQAELRAMRAARGVRGAAGMAGFAARRDIVLLRPLLDVEPAALRDFLVARGMGWVEDPSNADPRFERARLRMAVMGEVTPSGVATGGQSARQDVGWLIRHVTIEPAGFARMDADDVPIDALAALFRVIAGAVYPPARASLASLAAALRPATLGGVRIMKARGGGWLIGREYAACGPPIAARPGGIWDCRFRLARVPAAADAVGALGDHAAALRRRDHPPAAILKTLPAFFRQGSVLAVPHLAIGPTCGLDFDPPAPATATFTLAPDAMHACVRRCGAG